MKKEVFTILIILLLVNVAVAQQVIQVPQEKEKESGFFSPLKSLFSSTIFWGIIVFTFAFIILCLIIFFIIKALIKYIKLRTDLFYRLKADRIKLSKIHKRYDSKHWFKITKNTPIRLVKEINGKAYITKPIAYHRGDYTTHEGNILISINFVGNKKWFFFPITDLMIIPNKEFMDIKIKKDDGKQEIIRINKLPKPQEIIQFNENEILLFAESLSKTGLFTIPVIKSKEGKIINLSIPVFDSIRDVAISEYLYEQTTEFSQLAKKAMDINPTIRAIQKTQDANQNVDISSSQ